jgi:hypothetical protein
MNQSGLERTSLDHDLTIARRRADACTAGSPAWDAAMGLVQELEDELRRIEQASEITNDVLVLARSGG